MQSSHTFYNTDKLLSDLPECKLKFQYHPLNFFSLQKPTFTPVMTVTISQYSIFSRKLTFRHEEG